MLNRIASVLTYLLLAHLLTLSALLADEQAQHRVKIIARSEVSVNTAQVSLGDIAEIRAAKVEDDEIVLGLKRIQIGDSPAAGAEDEIPASRVIEAMMRAGVDLKQVGYLVPERIKVKRIGQPIRKNQITEALLNAINGLGRELSVREVVYPNEHMTIPGVVSLTAHPRGQIRAGDQVFDIDVVNSGQPQPGFSVKALIDEWAELPVAGRGITRGEVIGNSDVVRARMNLARLPQDTIEDESDVIGFEIAQGLRAGDVFRRSALKIPPLITKGSQVTIQYKTRTLEATAIGSALEDGIEGAPIRVRNEASKKIIVAKVIEPGLVRIEP